MAKGGNSCLGRPLLPSHPLVLAITWQFDWPLLNNVTVAVVDVGRDRGYFSERSCWFEVLLRVFTTLIVIFKS